MIALILMGILSTTIMGMFVFDLFDDNDNKEAGEEDTPPAELGLELMFDGSEILQGTEGDDTLPGGQDAALAPDTINLLGGDDIAVLEEISRITVSGGDGDDILSSTGVGNQLYGDAGNDTLTGIDANSLYGGAGDDTLSFFGNVFLHDENGRIDGGMGNDTINLRVEALLPYFISSDVGGVIIRGGSGSDEFNIVYELYENIETTDQLKSSFGRILDFEPNEDKLVIEVDRNDETADREVSVELDQTETDAGTFSTIVTLTFAETDLATEATATIRIQSTEPFTMDDIVLIAVS